MTDSKAAPLPSNQRLLARLRSPGLDGWSEHSVMREAASEIERLQKELAEAVSAAQGYHHALMLAQQRLLSGDSPSAVAASARQCCCVHTDSWHCAVQRGLSIRSCLCECHLMNKASGDAEKASEPLPAETRAATSGSEGSQIEDAGRPEPFVADEQIKILTRLKEYDPDVSDFQVVRDAIAEIERLRAALERIAVICEAKPIMELAKIAREALTDNPRSEVESDVLSIANVGEGGCDLSIAPAVDGVGLIHLEPSERWAVRHSRTANSGSLNETTARVRTALELIRDGQIPQGMSPALFADRVLRFAENGEDDI